MAPLRADPVVRFGQVGLAGRASQVGTGGPAVDDLLDGLYWLKVLNSDSNEDSSILDAPLAEDEYQLADVEVSSVSEVQRCIRVRVPGTDRTVRLDVIENPKYWHLKGGQVWPASVVAAAWMWRLGGKVLTGHILELGSGVGVFGVAAAAAGATAAQKGHVHGSLTLSDSSDLLVSNLRNTLSLTVNALVLDSLTSSEARILNWQDATKLGFVPHAYYDHVVAADCVYSEEHAVTLVATIVSHLKDGGSAYLVVPTDRLGLLETVQALSRHGTVVRAGTAVTHKMDKFMTTSTVYSMELIIFYKAQLLSVP
eukprot:gnl/MRDRNA2_/MRDRNA2_190065_c0_seq1.p1 gnl/MRDRNA2_/MRDRNA2_190065_c0~~gnl/MRDRNA2_/MRDRNA2_190065_c0_seq1.p1  ORF type:complete len:358 (+),score=51.61 gnl/MRDRNA2_/MRDRNA2_190065_c0_seq1:142-1074(+)